MSIDRRIVAGQQAVREATTQPETVEADVGPCRVLGPHRLKLHVGDASGERFCAMLHQIERGRAEQQELPCPVPCPTAFVDQAAQGGKELRRAVDLVDDGQPSCRAAQIGCGIIELAQILVEFQIEKDAVGPLCGDRPGQCGFAHLARTEEDSRSIVGQSLANHGQR